MNDRKYWLKHWEKRTNKGPNTFAKRAYARIKKYGDRNSIHQKSLKTVLDVGCGDGRDALYFAKKGLKVTAIDFAKSGIAQIKSADPNIKAKVADIRKLKFPKGSFDVIYAHLSLHYFTDRETDKIFQNLHRILKKRGLIFVKCKSTDDALYGKGKKVGPDMYRKGHTRHFFSKDYMAAKMKNFKLLELKRTSSVYHSYRSSYIETVGTK